MIGFQSIAYHLNPTLVDGDMIPNSESPKPVEPIRQIVFSMYAQALEQFTSQNMPCEVPVRASVVIHKPKVIQPLELRRRFNVGRYVSSTVVVY